MPDSAPKSTCSLTVAQGDSTIAFAYIKVFKTKKRRFFVLKSAPKASPWEHEGGKPSLDYHLYVYKSEKSYQKNDVKRMYNLSSVIMLSRCSKKENRKVLGICFQEDALFLDFATEDELNRWYFHLSEIYNVKRNCRWPELRDCYSVTLKPKSLASPSASHGKSDLAGQYRFCLTESSSDYAVLLVRDNLLSPVLNIPFQCIRKMSHSGDSSTFCIHLGRYSPIGEGELHFEVEKCMLKEVTDTIQKCLNSGRPTLRRGSSAQQSMHQETRSMSTLSERASFTSYSMSLANNRRTYSQPARENFDDYCDLSTDVQAPTNAASGSLNPFTSPSTNSEQGGTDAVQHSQRRSRPSTAESGLSNWRFDSLDAPGAVGGGSPPLGSRANSVGCRPPPSGFRLGSYLPLSYSVPSSYSGTVSQTGGHRDDRQVFVEMNFTRPRTTSDASRYRSMCGSSRIRPRTGSYGNRSAHRALCSQAQCTELGATGTELHSLEEACPSRDDDSYVSMSFGPTSTNTQPGASGDARQEEDEEDPYFVDLSAMDRMIGSAPTQQQCTVKH